MSVEEVYLDIETDWYRRVTVVGFWTASRGLVQLVGGEVNAIRLDRELPATGTLFTYNGHCFDLPCLRRQFGLDLRQRFTSVDLRYVCARQGLRGGQKAIERKIGVARRLPDLDGRDAPVLWSSYQRGNVQALGVLLAYNGEDVDGLRAIKDHLAHFRPL